MIANGSRLKCNREQPCQNCTARKEQITCKYKVSRYETTQTDLKDERENSMQQRIDRLEDLVKKLIAQRQDTPPYDVTDDQGRLKSETKSMVTSVASDTPDVTNGTGTTVIDGVHSVYKGTDDWYDVLQEVSISISLVVLLLHSVQLRNP